MIFSHIAPIPINQESLTVAFLAGYIVLILKERNTCDECSGRFVGDNTMEPVLNFITLLGIAN